MAYAAVYRRILESGHGKGIPDGIGAVVKSTIQNLIAYNPSQPIYTVKDLMTIGLQGHLSTVELYQYSSEDVAGLNNKTPLLLAVQGTAKLHEFFTKKEGEVIYVFVKNLSNKESRKVTLNLLQTNDHAEESEEEQDEEPDEKFFLTDFQHHFSQKQQKKPMEQQQ